MSSIENEIPTETVAKQIQKFLHDQGTKHIFGIVGREASAISFEEYPQIPFILTRHEMPAGLMAIAGARLTGRPGACFTTIGPGTTNAITPLASAMLDRYPLIVLVAQLETNEIEFNNAHQCVDAVNLAKPVTKGAFQVNHPRDVIPVLTKATQAAMTMPWGPVLVSLPIDILSAPAEKYHVMNPLISATAAIDTNYRVNVNAAADLLNKAKAPLFVIGDIASRLNQREEIIALADRVGAYMITTYAATGAVPNDHPRYLGSVTPYIDSILGRPALKEIFGPADTLCLFGYDIAEHLYPKLWHVGEDKKVIRLAPFKNETPGLLQVDVDVVAPLPMTIEDLNKKVISINRPLRENNELKEHYQAMLTDKTDVEGGILAHQVIAGINNVFGDYILASDVGMHRHIGALFARIKQPLSYLTSAGLSSFGTGLPLAIGAQLNASDRKVVFIAGDGGFHSSSGELETLARLKLPITGIIFKNSCGALIQRYQMMGKQKVNTNTTEYNPVDFSMLARTNGIHGFSATNRQEFLECLAKAKELKTHSLIEVNVVYPDLYVNQFTKNYHRLAANDDVVVTPTRPGGIEREHPVRALEFK